LRNGLLKGVQLPARIHWFECAAGELAPCNPGEAFIGADC
jgi:hypothetical protein